MADHADNVRDLVAVASTVAQRADGYFADAQVLVDDGMVVMRALENDDLEVRLRHRRARLRHAVVCFARDADPAALAVGLEASARRLSTGPRHALHLEHFRVDPESTDDSKGWIAACTLDDAETGAQVTARFEGSRRDTELSANVLQGVADLLAELQRKSTSVVTRPAPPPPVSPTEERDRVPPRGKP